MARMQNLAKKPLLIGPDHTRKLYGANLGEVFRTPLYDCSLKNVSGVPDFALTRLKGGSMEMQRAPAYPEDRAMLICVALAPTPVDRWRARNPAREGRNVVVGEDPWDRGQVDAEFPQGLSVLRLSSNPRSGRRWVPGRGWEGWV
jgi:hypothetical protein